MEELNNEEMMGTEGGACKGNQYIKGIRFKEMMGTKIAAFEVGVDVDIRSIEVYEYGMTDGGRGMCRSRWNGNTCTVFDSPGEILFIMGYRLPRVIASSI